MAAESVLTKHVQTILVSLATAAIGWMAYSVQENNVRLAVLVEKVDRLEHKAYVSADYPPVRMPDSRHIPLYPALPVSMPEPSRRK